MIISFSGDAGSGKSTVAKLLAKKLGMKRYYIGGMRRNIAKKKGMTLEEYNKLGETDPSTDNDIDEYQKKLGETEDNFIIEGRTSFYFIPHSYKIYVSVDEKVGLERIWGDLKDNSEARNEGKFNSIEDLAKSLKMRRECDIKRYKKYYGFNCYDKTNYDFVIDSSNKSPNDIVKIIISKINDEYNSN